MTNILVRKFGGAGLSTIEKVKQAAESLAQAHKQGRSVIAVVSAMGKTTDELIAKAYAISPRPDRRELDMLISTGERVSMSLLTMALKDMGCPAISFTGSQAGVLTDASHGFAKITEVKPVRVEESVAQNKIVVIAGFQGVDPATKEITTLGRGGTDTTAVAFAAHFKAARCEIVKEVDGIFTADPNLIQNAQCIANINYQTLFHMCQWGAKALHFRSVEMAAGLKTPIWVGSLQNLQAGTLCAENGEASGMNVLNQLYRIQTPTTATQLLQQLETFFFEKGWVMPVTISTDGDLWLQSSQEAYESVKEFLKTQSRDLVLSDFGWQCVTFSFSQNQKPLTPNELPLSGPLHTDTVLKTAGGLHLFYSTPLEANQLNELFKKLPLDLC